jgi:3-deoxy-D-manno-octulosonic-acid transferase
MTVLSHAYDPAIRLLRRLSPLVSGGSSKVARGVRGRVSAGEVLRDWGVARRDPHRAVSWFHAPSVGEGLQARAVLEAMRLLRPEMQAAFTYFSPSAVSLAEGLPVEVSGYLPWDVRSELAELLEATRPDLIAFTKTEVWPGLAGAAGDRNIPVFLVAATLPEGARRLNSVARALLRPTFASLERVFAISAEDGERFETMGVPAGRIEITGDPGIDSARDRALQAPREAPYLAPFRADARPTLVAGSTWRADEEVIVPALIELRREFPELRVVIAPHEPHPEELDRLEGELSRGGFRCRRLAAVEEDGSVEGVDVVLVDRVGVLAHLYTVGTVAHVGGGFGNRGLHSVLEPAAAGIPVLFGPRHRNARAAGDLRRIGGGVSVPDSTSFRGTLRSWLADDELRTEAGRRAGVYLEGHAGAARRTAEALQEYLPAPSGR